MKFYQYVFYTFYRWALALKTDKVPVFKSLLSLAIIEFVNVFSIFVFIEIQVKENIIPANMAKINIAILILALFGINYMVLVSNGKMKKIKERFRNESLKKRKTNQILIGSYVILTFVIFFTLMYFKSKTL